MFSEMLKTSEQDNVEYLIEYSSFLCAVGYLKVIVRMVLVVPVYDTIIRRYHPLDTKEGDVTQSISTLHHVLCLFPPLLNNIVRCLLHKFLS